MSKLVSNDAFTTVAKGLSNVLVNDVLVFPYSSTPPASVTKFKAIWDTGATKSVVSPKLVTQLSLIPSGMTVMRGVHGQKTVSTYFISIVLPNKVTVNSVRVAEGDLGNCDVLLGMDIIKLGDFSISNLNGRTAWTFRMPSCERACFIEESERSKMSREQFRKAKKQGKLASSHVPKY